MSRYRLPDPKCSHAPKARVHAGDPDGVYASTYVCDRPECVEDAMEWAEAQARQHATRTPLQLNRPTPAPEPEPSLFPEWEAAHRCA